MALMENRVPPMTFAKEIIIDGDCIIIKRQSESGYDLVESSLPVLVAVSSGINEPRYPQLKGIMAAKKTSELIPLCHQIGLSKVNVTAEFADDGIGLAAEAITIAQTGVEMEALTAVSVAALTIYDMCKAIQKDIVITDIRLESKTGGKEDYKRSD